MKDLDYLPIAVVHWELEGLMTDELRKRYDQLKANLSHAQFQLEEFVNLVEKELAPCKCKDKHL